MERSVEFWNSKRNKIFSRKGGWKPSQGVRTHGYSLLEDLIGNIGFFELLLLHVTGSKQSRELAIWLENAFMCLSWPDPRIWCNQIGSLGGSSRTNPAAAICAGTLAADSFYYGVGTLGPIYDFLLKAKCSVATSSIEHFIYNNCLINGKLKAPGFARPLAKGDERVEVMIPLAKKLGFSTGKFIALSLEISTYLTKVRDETINFAGYVTAFLMDQKFTKTQIVTILSLWVNNGVHACFVEAFENTPNSFLPLTCDDIEYIGPKPRPV